MSTEVCLQPQWEVRYEVGREAAKVKLIPGVNQFAEINGAEMAPGTLYDLPPGTYGSIFTWHGCYIAFQHLPTEQAYKAQSPVMQQYAYAHSVLEKKRRVAKRHHEDTGEYIDGPRVLVCGSASSGKATLSRMLVNYAAREDWHTTYVDLDVAHNTISLPGTVAAVPIDKPVPIDEGFSVYPPIASFYGCTSVEEKGEDLYHQMITHLAQHVSNRNDSHARAKWGGVVVKAKNGHKDILHSITAFDADVVLILDDDKLHAQLSASMDREGGRRTELIQLPKSGGCHIKTEADREAERKKAIDIYFNGWPHMKLHPNRYEVTDTSKVQIVKIGGSLPLAMDGLLPIGEKSTLAATDVVDVQPTKELVHSIIALSQATVAADAATAPVYGFARVLSVSEDGTSMVILITIPVTALESNIFVLGDIRYVE